MSNDQAESLESLGQNALADAVRARNHAMRQRDEERAAKEGNLRRLDAALVALAQANAETEAWRATADAETRRVVAAEQVTANVRALRDDYRSVVAATRVLDRNAPGLAEFERFVSDLNGLLSEPTLKNVGAAS